MHMELDLRNIKVQMRLFKIFGIWPQTDRHTYIHTHTRAQCSHATASVGLAPIIITIVRIYTRKYHEFVAVCIVMNAQHE